MVRQEFRVQSFESIDTTAIDLDKGVIRVAGALLSKLGGRNSLVKVSLVDGDRAGTSIVRIVRAATGESGLRSGQVALQYDDRQLLGLRSAGTTCELIIKPVSDWFALPSFLLSHTSPLVRREAVFALTLMALGAGIGFLIGLLIG